MGRFVKSLLPLFLVLSSCGGGAKQVEVFSWWTGGGEAAGLDAMIVVFGTDNPNIEFINSAVAGGAGTLSEVWGDVMRAAGATERLLELLHAQFVPE